jgi:hypothetical protein
MIVIRCSQSYIFILQILQLFLKFRELEVQIIHCELELLLELLISVELSVKLIWVGAHLRSFDFAEFYVSIVASFFVCEDTNLFECHIIIFS